LNTISTIFIKVMSAVGDKWSADIVFVLQNIAELTIKTLDNEPFILIIKICSII